jgi:hypothetical protein
MGVLFTAQGTARSVFGRLCGVSPGEFHQTAPDHLRAALVSALSGDDD